MTREEILERSRNENRGKDVADLEVSKSGMVIGWILVCILCGVTMVIDGIVFGRFPMEFLFCVLGALAAVFYYKFFKLRKKHELLMAIVYSVTSVCWLVSWIIQIANR